MDELEPLFRHVAGAAVAEGCILVFGLGIVYLEKEIPREAEIFRWMEKADTLAMIVVICLFGTSLLLTVGGRVITGAIEIGRKIKMTWRGVPSTIQVQGLIPPPVQIPVDVERDEARRREKLV